MAGFCPQRLYKGCHHLSAPITVTCTDIDVYYKIEGTWSDGELCNNGFVWDGNGKITYIGKSGVFFLFTGASDLQASKTCQVTYKTYINGTGADNLQTPTTFSHANAIRNMGITNIIKLNKDDYVEIFVKSDTASTDVTITNLFLTFLGDM